jgi:hypothetical protein
VSDTSAGQDAPDRYFFNRLIGPRPDFGLTLTPGERALMGRHAQYWRALMAEGKVIALGPVNENGRTWGLGLVRVASEAELDALNAADPVILAGIGAYYEHAPMMALVWAGNQ